MSQKDDIIILGYGFFILFKKFKRGIPEIEGLLDEIYNQTGISLDYHASEYNVLICVDKIYSINTLNLGSDDSIAFEVNEEEKKAINSLAQTLKFEGKIGWYLMGYQN